MKIRTNLFLLSAIFAILIVTLGFIMFHTSELINREVRESNTASKIIKDIFELNIVTYEYLTHYEERMHQQWLLKYDSLGKLLEGIRKEETRPERLPLLEPITSDYESLGDLFSQLQANFAKRKKLIEENRPQVEINLSLALEKRLITQALMRSQRITSEAFKFSAVMQQRITQVQQRTNSMVLFSIIGFVILSFCISFLTTRAITGPLNKLVKGVEIIGKGNLKHRVDIKTKSEIGELAARFDQMTKRRQRAKEALQKAHDELEVRVAQRTAELQSANKELEAFSYSVSHDLRTPLRAIDGFSKILLEDYPDRLDREGKRVLNVIRDNTDRMGELIDDILTLSRLGRKEMKKKDINMEKLTKDVFEELKGLTPERKLRMKINALPSAYGDDSLIREVLLNLLSNAIKFSKDQEVSVIEVGGKLQDNENVYYVKDNGVGFDMQYVDKLFGVFQRLHSQEEFKGTGVGLAIVQRIIHRHRGRVWAEGKVNKGATFYFTLPRRGGIT
jgi:signal transduction histidine kinase